MSFSDYLDEWLELRKPELKYNSVLMYTKLINIHIKPVLGKYKLSSIAAADIQKLVNDLFNAGVSRNTIAGVKGVVSGAPSFLLDTCKSRRFRACECPLTECSSPYQPKTNLERQSQKPIGQK